MRELIREFYHHAKFDEPSKFFFPDVRPEVMASLSELLDSNLTMQDVMFRFLQTLKNLSENIFSSQLHGPELEWLQTYHERMVERNNRILHA